MRFPATLDHFDHVVAIDFEFHQPPGEVPHPICCVIEDIRTGQVARLFGDKLGSLPEVFREGNRTLVVSFYASAELSCIQELGWTEPEHVLDLYVEFRWRTNGRSLPAGRGLLGALAYFGLDALEASEKEEMRDLAIRGGPFDELEREDLLAYCESDVRSLVRLFHAMKDGLDLPRTLLRGRYMVAVAEMERRGIPVDKDLFLLLTKNWDQIRMRLVQAMDAAGIWQGMSFREAAFERFLSQGGIPWPRHLSGRLRLDSETFRTIGRRLPEIFRISELRSTLAELRLGGLAIGQDGRNRCLLSPFQSKTGRNQPSTSKFIFAPSKWLRHLIRPAPGTALAYIDWSQQELGIAAALSGDPALQRAYMDGDPYIDFAVRAGLAPVGATKVSHPREREACKTTALGVLYGMGEISLSLAAGVSQPEAAELLRLHKQTYPRFWRWREAAITYAMLKGSIHSTFGWRLQVSGQTSQRTLANYPMQSNGAEMLRLAACFAQEAGVNICAPIHDALLIEAPAEEIDAAIAACSAAMMEASRVVLCGFILRTDVDVVRYPDRYSDPRGRETWEKVLRILTEIEPDETRAALGVPETDRCMSVSDTPGPSH